MTSRLVVLGWRCSARRPPTGSTVAVAFSGEILLAEEGLTVPLP